MVTLSLSIFYFIYFQQMSILQLQTFDSLFTKKDVKWIKFV